MTAQFYRNGTILAANDLDSVFAPLRNIQPYSNYTLDMTIGLATNFYIANLNSDIRFRYQGLSVPAAWNKNGVTITIATTAATATGFQANGVDLNQYFAATASAYTANITVSANTANLNLESIIAGAYLNSSFFDAVNIIIGSGVYIYSNDPTLAALVTGAPVIPITLTNNGTIVGAGGTGGAGGSGSVGGSAGGNGGPAINLSSTLILNNTNGYVYGGGGGGGGGGPAICQGTQEGVSFTRYYKGGKGGRGTGWFTNAIYLTASDGSIGAGPMSGCTTNPSADGYFAEYGGNGGPLGMAGTPAANVAGVTTNWQPGGAGGTAGAAIIKNSNTLTITGGNNTTQIIGSVS